MNELIRRQYWWPTLLTDVKKYVKGCNTCQRNKASQQPKASPLHPHSVPGGPWEDISADLIGPLPESKGHNAILAIIDGFPKMIRLIPTTTEITALRLAELYRDNIWKMHRLPRHITSDQGPQFAAERYIHQQITHHSSSIMDAIHGKVKYKHLKAPTQQQRTLSTHSRSHKRKWQQLWLRQQKRQSHIMTYDDDQPEHTNQMT
jgi:hypothetical protein